MSSLIIGASGRLGRRLTPLLDDVLTPNRAQLDALCVRSVRAFFKSRSVSRCVMLAASTNVSRCERDASYASETSHMAANVAVVCREHDVPLLYVSTDYVTPALRLPKQPLNEYAAHKLIAEAITRASGGQIARVSFSTPEQMQNWVAVNAYSVSNRCWVEELAPVLARYIQRGNWASVAAFCAPETTVAKLLRGRDPTHPALATEWNTPHEMEAFCGFSAPKDTRFRGVCHDEMIDVPVIASLRSHSGG